MNIAGLQPVSLIDYPGKVATILFTQGCLFRCSYCHNPDLVELVSVDGRASRYPAGEVLAFLESRKKMVDAVCITGGEPTIQPGLEDFIQQLKERGFSVKLDTSGVRPDVCERLLQKNLLDYIAMDIKHRWEAYPQVTQRPDKGLAEKCRATFLAVQSSGVAHEFRTTVFPGVHTPDDFFAIAGELLPGEQYYIQQTEFQKNLDPTLTRDMGFLVPQLIGSLQASFPLLTIASR